MFFNAWRQWLNSTFFSRSTARARQPFVRGFKPWLDILEDRVQPTVTITEFTTGLTNNSGVNEITAGPDGNVWFTESGGPFGGLTFQGIGKITPQGTVTEFQH